MGLALTAGLALTHSSAAQQLADEPLASYQAYIGTQDLYNSRGGRLSSAAQVLRQDRANVHKFGIWQSGDQMDPIFDTYGNRDVMTRVLERNGLDPYVARQIMRGNVMVYVEVWGHGNTVTAILVDTDS
ncbi:MAG TPA: hypothetical protein ENK83_02830 [Aliiroseovarius sp.]|nr:hypothetical protein [Aliiroseovarius sp.]